MSDQASSLRGIAEEQRLLAHAHSGPRRCRAITVTGGKGGVGKTAVAVNLALAFQTMGRRSLLFDADISLANADVMLHLSPHSGLPQVLRGECSIHEAVVEGPLGLSLLAGGSGLSEFASLGALQIVYLLGELRGLEQSYDILVVDTPAGIGPSVLSFCQYASDIVVLTTPEPTAMLDAFGLLKALAPNPPPGRLGVVVNLARNEAEAQGAYMSLSGTVRRFLGLGLEYLGSLPPDQGVSKGVRQQQPFFLSDPNSPASRSLLRLAEGLLRQPGSEAEAGSFFSGVIGAFMSGEPGSR